MFESEYVAVPVIILVMGLMQFLLMAAAAFVGSAAALVWHERRKAARG
jgi:hypothetical protein